MSRFDPYQRAMSALQSSHKRDLRKLEEWLKAKGMAEAVKREEARTCPIRVVNQASDRKDASRIR